MSIICTHPLCEDLAELRVSAKQCQRVAIRIGNDRIDEQQERIEAYTSASIPQQQHGQSDDAPANGWEGRVAVILCDGGRVLVRDDCWGKDKAEGKRHRWWRSILESPRRQARRLPPSPPQDQNQRNLANPAMHPQAYAHWLIWQ